MKLNLGRSIGFEIGSKKVRLFLKRRFGTTNCAFIQTSVCFCRDLLFLKLLLIFFKETLSSEHFSEYTNRFCAILAPAEHIKIILKVNLID
ncbi:hypothetical protein IQ65_07345 [Leptospira interrogans serovar Lai]|nr:hypothetical protein IQ65_07345 [Leptospira interrogans serovar Lai]